MFNFHITQDKSPSLFFAIIWKFKTNVGYCQSNNNTKRHRPHRANNPAV